MPESFERPHSGFDEGDYIEALETMRANLTERKKASDVDFFVGRDFDVEFGLDNADGDVQVLDSIRRYDRELKN